MTHFSGHVSVGALGAREPKLLRKMGISRKTFEEKDD